MEDEIDNLMQENRGRRYYKQDEENRKGESQGFEKGKKRMGKREGRIGKSGKVLNLKEKNGYAVFFCYCSIWPIAAEGSGRASVKSSW